MNLFSDFSSAFQNEVKQRMSNIDTHLKAQIINSPKLIVDKIVQQGNLSAEQLKKGLRPASPELAKSSAQAQELSRSISVADTGSSNGKILGMDFKMIAIVGLSALALIYFLKK